jgi:hypothetical protein
MERIFIRAAFAYITVIKITKASSNEAFMRSAAGELLQLGVFGFGGYQDGDLRVGVFP